MKNYKCFTQTIYDGKCDAVSPHETVNVTLFQAVECYMRLHCSVFELSCTSLHKKKVINDVRIIFYKVYAVVTLSNTG